MPILGSADLDVRRTRDTAGDILSWLTSAKRVTDLDACANPLGTYLEVADPRSGSMLSIPASLFTTAAEAASWLALPLTHRWSLTQASIDGNGKVTAIHDVGTVPRALVSAAGHYPTAGVGADGKLFVAGDGTAAYMTAGASADWTFMDGSSEYTLGAVVEYASLPSVAQTLLATAESGQPTGFRLRTSAVAAGQAWVHVQGDSPTKSMFYAKLSSSRVAMVIVNTGAMAADSETGLASRVYPVTMYQNGHVSAQLDTNSINTVSYYSSAADRRPLSLFASHGAGSSTPSIQFSTARIYDLWIHAGVLGAQALRQYYAYANLAWGV
jgi:hypothetical protein